MKRYTVRYRIGSNMPWSVILETGYLPFARYSFRMFNRTHDNVDKIFDVEIFDNETKSVVPTSDIV